MERDRGSAVRLAGLLVVNGLILGAAAAGDWIPAKFLHDFADSAWPAVALTAVAVLVERINGPRSSVGGSILLLLGYLIVAIAWVMHKGFGI